VLAFRATRPRLEAVWSFRKLRESIDSLLGCNFRTAESFGTAQISIDAACQISFRPDDQSLEAIRGIDLCLKHKEFIHVLDCPWIIAKRREEGHIGVTIYLRQEIRVWIFCREFFQQLDLELSPSLIVCSLKSNKFC
jgi:hypothetical protein